MYICESQLNLNYAIDSEHKLLLGTPTLSLTAFLRYVHSSHWLHHSLVLLALWISSPHCSMQDSMLCEIVSAPVLVSSTNPMNSSLIYESSTNLTHIDICSLVLTLVVSSQQMAKKPEFSQRLTKCIILNYKEMTFFRKKKKSKNHTIYF